MATFEAYTTYRGYILRLFVNETSTNIANNTSTVDWSLYIVNGQSGGSYYRFSGNFYYKVILDNSPRVDYHGWVDTTDVGYGDPHFLASGSYTIQHDSDGSKTIYCYAECDGGGGNGPGYGRTDGAMALSTLPRAATINSFTGNDIDGNFAIGYTKYVNEWTYYLGVYLNYNGTYTGLDRIVYNTSGATYRLPDSAKDIIYSKIGNDDTANIAVVIETWNGGSKVGDSSTLTNTCNVNRNMWLNVNGTWKRGIPYVNVNGTWKKGVPYIKINGVWKKAI